MGRIPKNFEAAGNAVNYVGHKRTRHWMSGSLAVPYPAMMMLMSNYKEQFNRKILINITNPLNFETSDDIEAIRQVTMLLGKSRRNFQTAK